jgi:hypothetical protein
MCTLVILRRPGHPWPLVLGANRDERGDRPWRPPGRHWPDRPEVVAGMDELAGGSWLGLNDHGVVAGVLNRVGSLGPEAGKRSRGELVLEALDHADAGAAAAALSNLDPAAYRSFNLVIGDNRDAYWLRHPGAEAAGNGAAPGAAGIEIFELSPGLSMLTARDRNDPTSARIRAHLPRFEAAEPPDPGAGQWRDWQDILGSRAHGADDGPEAAMTVATERGFGTVSSSLIAVPGPPQSLRAKPSRAVWLFAPGPPDRTPYAPVEP